MIVTNDKRREVAAKVRETMGELGQVELDGIPLADLIEPEECDGCEPGAWKVVAMEAAERLGVAVGGCLPSDYADAIGEALDRRLMPEVMEWPRFEDGAPVRLGDKFVDHQGNESSVLNIKMWQEGGFEIDAGQGTYDWHSAGERVKRPAHKVLDADGVEICEGDKPYRVDNGKKVEVRRIDPDYGEECVFVGIDGTALGYWLRPDQLTHERPVADTWERLEDDARQLDIDLNDTTDEYPRMSCCRDLVRRAKALAGVGE